MSPASFIYVKFRCAGSKRRFATINGELARFDNAVALAQESGYPDVLAYLKATGQTGGHCEIVGDDEATRYERAEACRRACIFAASLVI